MPEFIQTLGGPHLLIETDNLSNWRGANAGGSAFALGPYDPDGDCDYNRAARISGYAGVIQAGPKQAVSFWGDVSAIAFIKITERKVLFCRMVTHFEDPFEFAVPRIEDEAQFKTEGFFDTKSEDLIIIDAVDYGASLQEPYLKFTAARGKYEILTREIDEEEGFMILHIFRHVSAVQK
jgi:hypothetical protein